MTAVILVKRSIYDMVQSGTIVACLTIPGNISEIVFMLSNVACVFNTSSGKKELSSYF